MLDSATRELLEDNIRQHVQRRLGGNAPSAPPGSLLDPLRSFQSRRAEPPRTSHPQAGDQRLRLVDIVDKLSDLERAVRTVIQLQVDVQRSIRMEVAAALAGRESVQGSTGFRSPPAMPTDVGRCVVCLEAATECVVVRCGHMCMCQACGLEIKTKRMPCPVCRAPVTDIMRVFYQ
jgi:hypothetical protein